MRQRKRSDLSDIEQVIDAVLGEELHRGHRNGHVIPHQQGQELHRILVELPCPAQPRVTDAQFPTGLVLAVIIILFSQIKSYISL